MLTREGSLFKLRRPRGVAGVIAAVIMFATIFVVGVSFFLFVSSQFQAVNQAYVNRAGVQLQASQEQLSVTAGITKSSDPNCQSCIWVRANNTGGEPASVIDVYVTCLANCTGGHQQGQMLSGFLRKPIGVNFTFPLTLGVGQSTAFLTQCPAHGAVPHMCTADITINKANFTYAKGEYVVLSMLTTKGNVFSTQYPLPPISSQNYLTIKSVSTHIALSLIGGGPELSVLLKTTAQCPGGGSGCTQTFNCNNGCITVNATVYNLANSTATGVSFNLHTPYSDYVSGTASVTAFSPCSPLSQNIAAGKSANFACKFDANTGATGGLASFAGSTSGTLYGSLVSSAEGLSNAIEVGGLAAVTTQGAGVPNFFFLKYSSCYQNLGKSYSPPCTENASPLTVNSLPSGSYIAAGSNFYVAYYVQITNAFNTTVPVTQYSYMFGEPSNTGEAFFFLVGSNTTMTNGVYYPNYVPGNLTTNLPSLTPYPTDCNVVNAKNIPLDHKCIYINPGQTVTLTFASCGYGASNWAWAGAQDADGFDNSAGCTANPPNLCITQGACVPEGLALGIVLGYYYNGYLSQLMPFEGAALVRSTATYLSCSPTIVVIGMPTTCTATVVDTDNPNLKVSSPMGTVAFSGATVGVGSFSALSCNLSQGGNPVGTSSCSVTYTPTGPKGNYSMIASYSGDYYHDASVGSTNVIFGTTTTTTITTTLTTTVTTTVSTTATASSTTTQTITIPISSTTTTTTQTSLSTSLTTQSSTTTSTSTVTSTSVSTSHTTTTTTSSTTISSTTTIGLGSSTSSSTTTIITTKTIQITNPSSTTTYATRSTTTTSTTTVTTTSTTTKSSTSTSISSSTTTITTTSTTTISTTATSTVSSTSTSTTKISTTSSSTGSTTTSTTSTTTSSGTSTSTTTVPLSSSTTTSTTVGTITTTTTSSHTTTSSTTWTTTQFNEGLFTLTFSSTTTISSTTTVTSTFPNTSSTTTISGTSFTTSTGTSSSTTTITTTYPVGSSTSTVLSSSTSTSKTTISSTTTSTTTQPGTTSTTTITTKSSTTSSTTVSSTSTSTTTITTTQTVTVSQTFSTTSSTTTSTTTTTTTTSTTTSSTTSSTTTATTSSTTIRSTTTITKNPMISVDTHGDNAGAGTVCASSPCSVSVTTHNANELVVVFVLGNSCASTCSITISGGGLSWNTRIASQAVGTRQGAEFWAVAPSKLSSSSISVTYGAGNSAVNVMYVTIIGAANSQPYDPNAQEPSYANANSPAACTMTTSTPDDMLIGVMGQGGTPSWTPPTGWTSGDLSGAFEKFDAWNIIVGTVTSQSETWTAASGSNISGLCEAIQPAGTTTTTSSITTSTTTISSTTTSSTTITVTTITTTITSTSFGSTTTTVSVTTTSSSTSTSTTTQTTTVTTTSTSTVT